MSGNLIELNISHVEPRSWRFLNEKKTFCCFENIFQLTKQGAALRAVCHLQVAHLFDWMKTGVGQYVGNRLIKQCDHLRPDRYASNAVLVTSHSL